MSTLCLIALSRSSSSPLSSRPWGCSLILLISSAIFLSRVQRSLERCEESLPGIPQYMMGNIKPIVNANGIMMRLNSIVKSHMFKIIRLIIIKTEIVLPGTQSRKIDLKSLSSGPSELLTQVGSSEALRVPFLNTVIVYMYRIRKMMIIEVPIEHIVIKNTKAT